MTTEHKLCEYLKRKFHWEEVEDVALWKNLKAMIRRPQPPWEESIQV